MQGESWWVTPEIMFLREIDYGIRTNVWLQTEDARKGQRHQPEKVPLPTDTPEGDPMMSDLVPGSVEEIEAWLREVNS